MILLNTCAIREHAEERIVGRLTDLARLKTSRPELVLGMSGCMAQHHRAAITRRVPMLDLVVGPDAYRRLPSLLDALRAARRPITDYSTAPDTDPNHVQTARDGAESAAASRRRARWPRRAISTRLDPNEDYADLRSARTPGAVRAWVTVMRGCDKFCTFCVVPYVRGRERSLPVAAVLRDVREAVAEGAREITFLGQTVNAYRDGDCDFAELLRRAAAVPGVARIRFTSPHPADVTPELIRVMREVAQIAPQLHLPVQSGSDAVLTRMARGYTVATFRELVAEVREAIPEIALSTDVIVGFPDESAADFEATHRLLEEIRFDQAYTYKYSPRSLTRAADLARLRSRDGKVRAAVPDHRAPGNDRRGTKPALDRAARRDLGRRPGAPPTRSRGR